LRIVHYPDLERTLRLRVAQARLPTPDGAEEEVESISGSADEGREASRGKCF
jgi:hypothetical protein